MDRFSSGEELANAGNAIPRAVGPRFHRPGLKKWIMP